MDRHGERGLVVVEWHDAYSHCESPWITKEELEREMKGHAVCFSAGWVVREDSDYITVSLSKGNGSDSDTGEVGPAVSIPKGMINSIKRIPLV